MKTAFDIVIKPVVTENSMMQMSEKKYTFQVHKEATKTEIKDAVESIFGVEVSKVNTMNVTGKLKRQGRFVGRRASWKKAIITLTEASKEIEFFEGM
jgi:large subunit ribosomal protein L23